MPEWSPRHDVERLVHAELGLALMEHGVERRSLAAHDLLTANLGLTSLQVAAVAARLAVVLGADPFARSAALTEVRTVGDLCRAFETAVGGTSPGEAALSELAAARRRAEARRGRMR